MILAFVFAACSGKETDDGGTGGGSGGSGPSGTGGDSSAGGPSSGGAPGTGSGGAASVGGSGSGGVSAAGEGGTGSGSAGSGSGGETALVSCDHRQVLCKSAEPTCPDMQVASVEAGCWGPCTRIDHCACGSAAECPHEEQYTCWGKEHCGPYVN